MSSETIIVKTLALLPAFGSDEDGEIFCLDQEHLLRSEIKISLLDFDDVIDEFEAKNFVDIDHTIEIGKEDEVHEFYIANHSVKDETELHQLTSSLMKTLVKFLKGEQ